MFETFSLSFSVALFFICNILAIGALNVPFPDNSTSSVIASSSNVEESPNLIGKWNSGGKIFEFKEGGKLIFNNNNMDYILSGDKLIVRASVLSDVREYSMDFLVLSDRVISINGVKLYRVE